MQFLLEGALSPWGEMSKQISPVQNPLPEDAAKDGPF